MEEGGRGGGGRGLARRGEARRKRRGPAERSGHASRLGIFTLAIDRYGDHVREEREARRGSHARLVGGGLSWEALRGVGEELVGNLADPGH